MSGGVDSSVTAYLLKEQGYDVFGVTFRNWPQDCLSRAEDKCCGPQAVADARMVANTIGIPHFVVDEIGEFQKHVIDYFVAEYRQGRTPNPCVVCNNEIKFGTVLAKARALGAEHVATGHYARIELTEGHASAWPPANSGRAEARPSEARYRLRKGRDDHKDQSYFLFGLSQEQLAHALMPVGELTKAEVRAVARKLGLKTHDKVESQEICFVPEADYGRYLRDGAKLADRPGEIVDQQGRVLGQHAGIQYFTIGQREGLKLGGQKSPLYVAALDAATNRVVVGPREALLCAEFEIERCNWIAGDPTGELMVKIRYNHRGCPATVRLVDGGRARVTLPVPQRAVTPGQAAVFYRDDLVVGGGWIVR
jgi:tRNA-specific 2-thiouridylase